MTNFEIDKRTQHILNAAEICILRYGLSGASMDMVAAQAGLSRRTLYRAFRTKEELFVTLFEYHCLTAKFNRVVEKVVGLDFEKALIEAIKLGTTLIRQDKLMMEMMHKSGAFWFQKQMMDPDSLMCRSVISICLKFWEPIIEEARKTGEIKTHLTNQQLMEWYAPIQYMMILRVKSNIEELDFIIKNFIAPSLLNHSQV